MTMLTFNIDKLVDTATAKVDAARNQLYTRTVTEISVDHLADYVNDIAEAEGQLYVYRTAQEIFRSDALPGYDASCAAVLSEVTDLLAYGADDTWSGRRNDVRRARFDGVRDAAKKVIRMVTS